MRKKAIIVLLICGVLTPIFVSVLADRLAGFFLNRSGYFTLMYPGKRELYDTEEFTVEATVSAQGLRNSIVAQPKPKDTYRILALGDSFTFGWGVIETDSWVRKLESKLKSIHPSIEIVNAGAPGLGIDGYSMACGAYADRFEVDGIIIGLYGTDDIYQAASTIQNLTWVDRVVAYLWPTLSRLSTRVIIDPWFSSGPREQYVIFSTMWSEWARNYFVGKPGLLAKIPLELRTKLLRGKVNPSLLRGAEQDSQYQIKMLDEKNAMYAANSTRMLLTQLKRCAGNRSVLIVYLPSSETVSEYFFPYRKAFGFEVDQRLLTFRPDNTVRQIATDLGFSFVTLLPQFRSMNCRECFYPWDIHMTPLGNEVVASTVSAFIASDSVFRF